MPKDYISRDIAISELMPIYKSASLRNRNVFATARKCLEAIENIPAADVIERPRWISVEEEHPFAEYGEGKSVLTVDSLGIMRVAYWNGGNWLMPSGDVIATARMFPITHWMPLPEPPKEDNNG